MDGLMGQEEGGKGERAMSNECEHRRLQHLVLDT